MSFDSIYKNKNVVVTGHTGFKGSWLSLWLKMLGANVTGIALEPKTIPSNYDVLNLSQGINDKKVNLLDYQNLEISISNAKPDFIFHLAAQAIVKDSYINPIETWQTNLIGTINILEILKNLKKKCSTILITSDKCYKNKEWIWGYRESDELGGLDPYSASKAATELAIKSYNESFFSKDDNLISVCSARAGNVIGGGDWSNSRLLPDCIKSWSKSDTVTLRNPNSTRPWQHVLEPLSGYLSLAYQLDQKPQLHGESFNFAPTDTKSQTVLDVVKEMSKYWKKVNWKIIDEKSDYESSLLKLNCDKAQQILEWKSVMSFEKTIQSTSEWYEKFYENKTNMESFTRDQILEYTDLANKNNYNWAK